MQKQTLTQKLAKTAASLSAHVSRGNRLDQKRSLELVDRYNSLREAASLEEWTAYCESVNWALGHDGYDFFA